MLLSAEESGTKRHRNGVGKLPYPSIVVGMNFAPPGFGGKVLGIEAYVHIVYKVSVLGM